MAAHVEGVERHKEDNPYKYTEDQLAEKEIAVRNACLAYPDVPRLWVGWAYDVVTNTPLEELKEMMDKIDKSKPMNPEGGVLQTAP